MKTFLLLFTLILCSHNVNAQEYDEKLGYGYKPTAIFDTTEAGFIVSSKKVYLSQMMVIEGYVVRQKYMWIGIDKMNVMADKDDSYYIIVDRLDRRKKSIKGFRFWDEQY